MTMTSILRRTFLAGLVALPIAAWSIIKPRIAKALSPPPPGVQPNGNLVGTGPNPQLHLYGEDAGLNTWITGDSTDPANIWREGYWLVTAQIGGKKKIMSISAHPYKTDPSDWGGVLRLNAGGTPPSANMSNDDLFLRGWAHNGAAFWYNTSEFTPPGRNILFIGGRIDIDDWLRGAGSSTVMFKSNGDNAGSIGLSGYALGSGDDLVVLAQAGRKVVIVPGGDSGKAIEIRPDGDIYRAGDSVGLYARVAALES